MKAEINGTEIAYTDTGTGLPLLLIHGFPLCRAMWQPQVAALSGAGCRVIALDLPGFGESGAINQPGMNGYADTVAGLLDYLRLDKAAVAGMSMGGYVLLNLLERHPDRVAAALFVVTKAGADDDAGKARRTALANTVTLRGNLPIAEQFRELLFAPETAAADPELVEQVFGWMRGASPKGLAAGLLSMRDRKDCTPLLSGFRQPALVIGADQDRAIPPEQSLLLAEGLPDADLLIIHGAGHLVNLEQPEAFNQAVLDFLSRLGEP